MKIDYYLKNLMWGILFFGLSVYNYDWGSSVTIAPKLILHPIVSGINTLLFPFSKRLIENIALHYTTKEFWSRGLFMETSGKNGVYAVFYLFCFFFAIPLGLIYLIFSHFKKQHYS